MKILGLFSASKYYKGKVRPKKDILEFIVGYGIKDDKFYGINENRAVMVVPKIAYEILEREGIKIEYGSLGENILVEENIMKNSIGDILDFQGIKLQITEICTICNHLAYFDKRVPKLVKDYRGVYCKILNNGILKKDDR